MNVLVTGATGTVGAHVVRALGERGVAARAFVRDPERAADVLGADVELAVGDFADRRLARIAPCAASTACSSPAATSPRRWSTSAPSSTPRRRRAWAAWSSCRARGRPSTRPCPSSAGTPRSSATWSRSAVPYVLLRPSTYMTNLRDAARRRGQGDRAAARARWARAEIAFVDPRDVAAAAAATLAGDGHEGAAFALTGPEALTYRRIAQALSAATGRPIEYVDVPEDAARQGMAQAGLPAPMVEAILAVFAAQRAGALARTTRAIEALTGREPRTFARFAHAHAAAFGAAELVS